MKKNGFIATSLIYSFFLIFITLFLGVIAKYLQNRILLSETEASIKAELNNKISIKDINVGDYVAFMGSGCDASSPKEYVVANVIVDDTINSPKKCSSSYSSCLILYNLNVGTVSTSSYKTKLTYTNIQTDITEGYRNETFFNKILYTFTGSSNPTFYRLNDGYDVSKNGCSDTDIFKTSKGCIKEGTSGTNYRERYIYNFSGTKTVCTDLTSSGSFYLAS